MKHVAGTQGEWQQCPSHAKKIVLAGRDLHAPGTLMQLIEIAPKTCVADHYHEHCTEAFHVVAGRSTVSQARPQTRKVRTPVIRNTLQ